MVRIFNRHFVIFMLCILWRCSLRWGAGRKSFVCECNLRLKLKSYIFLLVVYSPLRSFRNRWASKLIKNNVCISERSLYVRFYWTLVALSWVNSVIFATPPLFGYGKYSCDATGTACTFLWPSLASGAKHIGFSIPYILFCGIIPVIAM